MQQLSKLLIQTIRKEHSGISIGVGERVTALEREAAVMYQHAEYLDQEVPYMCPEVSAGEVKVLPL